MKTQTQMTQAQGWKKMIALWAARDAARAKGDAVALDEAEKAIEKLAE